jgi:hypothetical protein
LKPCLRCRFQVSLNISSSYWLSALTALLTLDLAVCSGLTGLPEGEEKNKKLLAYVSTGGV